MLDERFLEICLGVGVLEIEKLQHIRVSLLLLWGYRVGRLGTPSSIEYRGLALRERSTLVELGLNRTVKLTYGPPSPQGLSFVELPGLSALERQEAYVR